MIFRNLPSPHLFISAVFCLGLYLLGVYCRPIFPVDETRYLTVAWEMLTSGDYILPHLNYEPYDHKPPLLFWSINLVWKILGVSRQAAMTVPFLFAFAFVSVTARLARRMLPEEKDYPALVTYLLLGSLPFIVYSNVVMFDLLLGVFAVLGLTAIWDYAHDGRKKNLALYALAVGFGALVKGPVILLHTLFPLVFVRFWRNGDSPSPSRKKWIAGFTLAIIAGICLGLCWAVPAAIKGGPAFANKLFWGQTAGRIANAFDHKHPFYWYLQYLPALLAPWIFSPLLWRGIKNIRAFPDSEIFRFIAFWLPPVFFCFCLISGKQVHYLIPLVPGFALFVGVVFTRMADRFRAADAVPPLLINGTAILIPAGIKIARDFFGFAAHKPVLAAVIDKIDYSAPVALFIFSALVVCLASRRGLVPHVIALVFSGFLLMTCFQLESRDGLFRNYDLAPMAGVVERFPDTPLAFARNYHGEWGFMARLRRPVEEIDIDRIPAWFAAHPDGLVFMRSAFADNFKPYDVVFSMFYQTDDIFNIIAPKGRGKNFTLPKP